MKKLLLMVAVLLAGCSGWPQNVTELKARGVTESFTVNQPYQQAYRNFKTASDRCMSQAGLWQMGSTVDAQLYPDANEGQFIIKLVTQWGQPKPIILITVNRLNDQQSIVSLVHLDNLDKASIPVYRRWLDGNLSCE